MIPDATDYTATLGSGIGHRSPVARRKLRVLDLFCKAGGASVGYWQAFTDAGFDVDVTGVDIEPQQNYPFAFRVGDALTWPLNGYDFIHASPPCQDHTRLAALAKRSGKAYNTGWMLDAIYQRLRHCGTPWIIENVTGASMKQGLMLCGTMFGLRLLRHRLFDSSHLLYPPTLCHHRGDEYGVYGSHVYAIGSYSEKWKPRADGRRRPNEFPLHFANEAMGIDWMNWKEITQAIPPAYTRWLGMQIARVLEVQP